jgi:hypothetical protein
MQCEIKMAGRAELKRLVEGMEGTRYLSEAYVKQCQPILKRLQSNAATRRRSRCLSPNHANRKKPDVAHVVDKGATDRGRNDIAGRDPPSC